jgi:polyisoprenyl-phosphate glycosyltransferase
MPSRLTRAGFAMMRRLTIICPVYNEERVIPMFFARIHPVIEKLQGRYRVELVFLNNASTDSTLSEVMKLRVEWPYVYVLSMSRNVGYQKSLDCGLQACMGDVFAFIDVDCEDPPEMLLDFVEKYEEGFDIVYGIRADREEIALLKSLRRLFYRILKAVADEDIILDMAEFSLFTSEVRDAMILERNSFPFVRASISRVGYRRVGIPFSRQRRIGGETHYNLFGMSAFALAGILSASTLMLRLPILLFPLWLAGLILCGVKFVQTGLLSYAVSGAILFASYLGLSVAFVGLYVARTYKNGLHRPNAHIRKGQSVLQSDAGEENGSSRRGGRATAGLSE